MTANSGQAQYSMVLEWDRHDRMYVVTVPDLPGCKTPGTTRVEAVARGADAIETWLDGVRAWGDTVLEPTTHNLNGPSSSTWETRTNGVS